MGVAVAVGSGEVEVVRAVAEVAAAIASTLIAATDCWPSPRVHPTDRTGDPRAGHAALRRVAPTLARGHQGGAPRPRRIGRGLPGGGGPAPRVALGRRAHRRSASRCR